MPLDFRTALNTISDVVQNRPTPLREFDQIYMKVGDMVIQTEYIARQFDNMNVIFIGDGDSISLSIMHLKNNGVFDYGPKSIHVLDFDERIVNSINRFAKDNGLCKYICAELYNVSDPLRTELISSKDAFYTNPPWGASNEGSSVITFALRGIEAIKSGGCGAIIIGDDDDFGWTKNVLYKTQDRLIKEYFYLAEMIPGLHHYHLDDAPNLKSCTMLFKHLDGLPILNSSSTLNEETLVNFYGRQCPLKVKYIRDLSGANFGKAPDSSYKLEPLEYDYAK